MRACALALEVDPSLVSRVYNGKATSARVAKWLAKPPARWLLLTAVLCALALGQDYADFKGAPVEAYGKATQVPHDGDTPKVALDQPANVGKVTLTAHNPIEIRLRGADSPEMAFPGRWAEQPGAVEARNYLSLLLFDPAGKPRTIRLEITGLDRYGRPVANMKVFVNRRPVDMAEYMIEAGWAWHDSRNVPAGDNLALRQCRASSSLIGIWRILTPTPVPPWVWRNGK